MKDWKGPAQRVFMVSFIALMNKSGLKMMVFVEGEQVAKLNSNWDATALDKMGKIATI